MCVARSYTNKVVRDAKALGLNRDELIAYLAAINYYFPAYTLFYKLLVLTLLIYPVLYVEKDYFLALKQLILS